MSYFMEVDGDNTVNQVIFMKTRAYNKDSASLVASGPHGCIHMWNVFQGGNLLAKFRGVSEEPGLSLVQAGFPSKPLQLLPSLYNY